jgi:hypothetical protein
VLENLLRHDCIEGTDKYMVRYIVGKVGVKMRGVKLAVLSFAVAITAFAGVAYAASTGVIVGLKILGSDTTPPSNVSNLTATPGDSYIDLNWTNPGDADFAGVRIVKREDHYPVNEIDGEIIEAGLVTTYHDSAVINGTRYYYTVFAYDNSHNYASGVIISEVPQAGSTPSEPATTPTGGESEVSSGSASTSGRNAAKEYENLTSPAEINSGDLHYYSILPKGLLELHKDQIQSIRVYRESEVLVSFDVNLLPENLDYLEVVLNSSHYLMREDAYGETMQLTFTAPKVLGDYDIVYIFHYLDSSEKALSGKLTVVPYGYIYEESTTFWPFAGKRNKRVEGAVVTLYQKIDDSWTRWNGEPHLQDNPQVTNDKGEYAFLAPDGEYYLKIEKSGFYLKEGGEFTLSDQIINKNYKINREYDIGAIMTVILIALLILAVEYLLAHREKKKYQEGITFGNFPGS